jgi:hypothetical protein
VRVCAQPTEPLPTVQRASTAGVVVRHRDARDLALALMRALAVSMRRILGEDIPSLICATLAGSMEDKPRECKTVYGA